MVKNSVFLGLMLVFVSLLYSSCEETSTLGFPAGDKKIQTIFLDTFTVKTSTILLDSISTSTKGRILVGEYHDAVFGKTSSSSFLQLGSQDVNSWTPQSSAIFDSVSLILKYDKYFYGDTTKVQNLTVNELSENITYRNFPISENLSYFYSGGLFNNSKTNTYPTTLGTKTYKPNPVSGNKISIRLADEKGKQWFTLAQGENKSELFSSNFLDIFKGVKISTPTSTNSAVIGFVADSTVMRIYYSEPNSVGTLTQKHFDFKLFDSSLQYNQINTDRTGTPLQNLVSGSAVSSELTNNETYIQAGAGIVTKVEFPNFKYLTTNNEQYMILSARLVVIPNNTLDGQKKLPSDLGLFIVNKADIPTSPMARDFDRSRALVEKLSYLQGNTLVAGEDKEFNRTTQYSFSIIQYTDTLVAKQTNVIPALVLSMPQTEFSNSVTQLRIGNGQGQTSKVKLEIYLSRLK